MQHSTHSTRSPRRHLARAILALFFVPALLSGQVVWNGGGADNNWSTAANWIGGTTPPNNGTAAIQLDGSTRTTPSTDTTWSVASLTFNAGASAFTLSGSTLTIGGSGITNASTGVVQTVSVPLTLNAEATFTNADTVVISGNVDNNGNWLILSGSGAAGSISGVISGSGGLSKSGSGLWTLSGANTYVDSTVVQGGVLNIRNNSALGASASAAMVNPGAAVEVEGNITVTGKQLTLYGAGVSSGGALRNVSGDNTWTGAIQANSAVKIQSDAGTLTLSGGITKPTGGEIDPPGQNLTFAGAGNITVSGVIATGTGTLTKTGTGTLTLSGANTYTGATNINMGTLQLGANNTLSSSTAVTVANDATFDVQGKTATIGALAGGGAVTLGAGTLTSGSDNSSTTFSGVVSGATGTFIKAGSGTLTLSGQDSARTTQIDAGTLRLGANNVFTSIDINSGLSVNSGATLDLNDKNATVYSLRDGSSGGGNITLGSGALTIGAPFAATGGVFNGVISGTGSVNKNGPNTITLGGTNSYSGGTTVSGGTLGVSSDSNLGAAAGPVTLGGSVTLWIGGTFTSDRSLSLGGASAIETYGDSTLTWNGIISGGAYLQKTGTGILVLGGVNTYTGGTQFLAGTVRAAAANNLGGLSNDLVFSGGTLQASGSFATGRPVSLTTAGTFDTPSGITLTLSGTISGSGTLTKSGTGTLSLSGTNTYSGITSINSGTLKISGSASSSAFAVNSGGILSGSGSVGALTIASGGTLAPGNSPGTLNAGATTWAGGGTYIWEINNATGTRGTDPGWDWLNVTGALTITATSGNPFTIALTSLTNGNVAGAAANFSTSSIYSYTLATASGGFSGFDASKFAINTTAFQNSFSGTWSLATSGNDLNLIYTGGAIPEPATYAAVFGLIALGFAAYRRRHRRRADRH